MPPSDQRPPTSPSPPASVRPDQRFGVGRPSRCARRRRHAHPVARLPRRNGPPRVRQPPPIRSPADRVLSDERTVTRWACAAGHGPIFAGPDTGSGHFWAAAVYRTASPRSTFFSGSTSTPTGGSGSSCASRYRRTAASAGCRVSLCIASVRPATWSSSIANRLRMQFFTEGQLCWSAPVAVGQAHGPDPCRAVLDQGALQGLRLRVALLALRFWHHSAIHGSATGRSAASLASTAPAQTRTRSRRLSQACIAVGVADNAWLAEHLGLGTPLLVL